MKISVIIPMYKASLTMAGCLQALNAQTQPPDEVIIVDNGSNDQSMALVTSLSKDLTKLKITLTDETKKGASAARNKGVSLAVGDILAFIDSDCYAAPDWIEQIKNIFERDSNLDAVGGIYRFFIKPKTLMGHFLSAFWISTDEVNFCAMKRKEDLFAGQFFATANCAMKRSFFEKLEGFDESFIIGEDIDMVMRAVEAQGKVMVWNPQMIVCHIQDITFRGLLKKTFEYGKALARLSRRHFLHKVILKKGAEYNCIDSTWTVVLMGSAYQLLVFAIVMAISTWFCWPLVPAVMTLGLLYLFVRVRRFMEKTGMRLTLRENFQAFVYFIAREIAEEAGRVTGSIQYQVICL